MSDVSYNSMTRALGWPGPSPAGALRLSDFPLFDLAGGFWSDFQHYLLEARTDRLTIERREMAELGVEGIYLVTNELITAGGGPRWLTLVREVEGLALTTTIEGEFDLASLAGTLAGFAVGAFIAAVAIPAGTPVGVAILAGIGVGMVAAVYEDLVTSLIRAAQDNPEWLGDTGEWLLEQGEAILDLGADILDGISDIPDMLEHLAELGVERGQDFLEGILGDVGSWIDGLSDRFSNAINDQLRRLIDPIVLDLDGDGIELLSQEDAQVFFDMDGDGVKELTGWVGPDDGLLVLDQGGDRRIESVNELIGDLGQSGFAELLRYDTNDDLIFDARDERFSRFRVWVDANTNGISEDGELITLAAAGISAIDLNFTTVNFTAEGNQIHEQSTFERTDGTTGIVVDAWFEVDNVIRSGGEVLTGDLTIDSLPEIPGYGDLPSLREAMAANGALATLVASLASRDPSGIGNARALTEQILFRWANAEGIDPQARGEHFDARRLAVLEAMLGTEFTAGGNPDPQPWVAPTLQDAWDSMIGGVMARILLSGATGEVLDGAIYSPSVDRILSAYSPAALMAEFAPFATQSSPQAIAQYWIGALDLAGTIAREQGLNVGDHSYRQAVTEALRPFGLANVSDLLGRGILPIELNSEGAVSQDGLFRGTAEGETIYVDYGRVALFAGGGADQIYVSEHNWYGASLFGGAGDDLLQGGNGEDWLDGEAGADLLYGGHGNDTYVVDSAADQIFEARDAGQDTVRAALSFELAEGLENLVLLGPAIYGTGNSSNNHMQGNANANRLSGLAGDDYLDGGAGADRLIGGRGRDTYVIDNVGDVIVEQGRNAPYQWAEDWDVVEAWIDFVAPDLIEEVRLQGFGDLRVTGNSADNRLFGNVGDNVLNGGVGADYMEGGAGDDVYHVGAGDSVYERPDEGFDTVVSTVGFYLPEYIEVLRLSGTDNIDGIGNSGHNRLFGNDGHNRLDGGGGADRMVGGLGDDIYVVDHLEDQVVEAANAGLDTVETVLRNYTLGNNLENLTMVTDWSDWTAARTADGNSARNVMRGTESATTLRGQAGDDQLFGMGGDDRLEGGLGADELEGGEGLDQLYGGEHDDILLGQGGNDRLEGDAGSDLLDGGSGDDTMLGGLGDDVYVVDASGDRVTELADAGHDRVESAVSFILGTNLEDLVLTGWQNIDGQGNALNNRLQGNAANNNLNGAGGADVMIGDAGNDTYTVDNVGDRVIETPGAGDDTVRALINYTLGVGVERLILLGTSNLTGRGNELSNELTGNSANNLLFGFRGNDGLNGGAGDDVLEGGVGSDRLDGGHGIDTASYSSSREAVTVNLLTNYAWGGEASGDTLTAIENITGSAFNDVLSGDSLANLLAGGLGDDQLAGGGGADTLNGGDGLDLINGGAGDDALNGGNGADTLNGGDGRDILAGGQGDDVLAGGLGNDELIGGQGVDILSGGGGNDLFIFRGASGSDTITDFAAGVGVGDVISLDPSIFVDFADVRAHATNDGSGNVVIAKGGISITLTGVIKGDLKADDFIFGAAGSPVAKVSSPLTQPPSDDGLDPLVLPAGLDSKIAVDELPIVCPPGEDGVPSPLRPWIDLAELGLSTFDGRDPHRLLTEARGIDWIV